MLWAHTCTLPDFFAHKYTKNYCAHLMTTMNIIGHTTIIMIVIGAFQAWMYVEQPLFQGSSLEGKVCQFPSMYPHMMVTVKTMM